MTERGPISTIGPSISVCHRMGRFLRADQTFPPHPPPPSRGAEGATRFLAQGAETGTQLESITSCVPISNPERSEFTIYQSLCFPSAVYPVLAQGGKWDETKDPFAVPRK